MKELMKEKEGQIGGIIGDLHAKLERKEKEIEDLQGLLSRSFKSINSSADNFRMASKLDHEVEELTKRINPTKEGRQQ